MHLRVVSFIIVLKFWTEIQKHIKFVITRKMNMSVIYIYASLLKQIVTSLTTFVIRNVRKTESITGTKEKKMQ